MAIYNNGRFFEETLTPTGRLNRDVDVRDLPAGDFIDSLATRGITNLGGTTRDREIILGTTLAYFPETIVLQNKIIRITITSTGVGNYRFTFQDGNGATIASTAALAVTAGNLAATYATIAAGIAATLIAPQTYIISPLTTTSANNGYFEIEITTVPYWNYNIINFSTSVLQATFTTIQEPVDQNLIGEWWRIGKYDLQGEEISWWTTQRNLPLKINVANVVNNAGQIEIFTASIHGRVSNEKVSISGVLGVPADGTWIITVTGTSSFILQGSVFAGAWTGGGIATMNPSGNGEIGHAVKNEQVGTWAYFRLIRSQVFNFVTKKQIDTYCEKDSRRKNYYWTDDYNVPKVLYDRTLTYQDDVLLTFVDPINTYDYATLGIETILQVSYSDIILRWIGQLQSGGNIYSGNSRYVVRGLTDTLSATEWIPVGMDNPINAFRADISASAYDIVGDAPLTSTGKINQFLVTGTLLGVFKYIELAVVNYQGNSKSGWIVRRELVTSNSMTLQHTGFETGTQDLDVGTIGAIQLIYSRTKNIDCLDGRIIFSNLETNSTIDFSEFTLTFTHSLLKKTIIGAGEAVGAAPYIFSEYMNFNNVYNFMGYMINETYRFGAYFILKNGSKTPVFHIQDITFDTNGAFPRRVVALTNGDLGNGAFTQTFVPYIQFSNINLDFLVDGVRVRDLVDYIVIVRVDCVPEVLFTGLAVVGVSSFVQDCTSVSTCESLYYSDVGGGATRIGEYPWIVGRRQTGFGNYPAADPLYPGGFTQQRRFVSIYSSDVFFSHVGYDFLAGDTVNNYGVPQAGTIDAYANNNVCVVPPIDGWEFHLFNEYSGNFNGVSHQVLTVNDGISLGFNTGGTVGGSLYDKRFWTQRDLAGGWSPFLQHSNERSPVLFLSANATSATGFADRGAMYMQYFRAKVDKYGNVANSQYVPTGASASTDTLSSLITIDVFGGDTFTQKNFLKKRLMVSRPVCGVPTVIGDSNEVSWYSQNRINAQMLNPPDAITNLYPYGNDLLVWLNEYSEGVEMQYNEGYTIRNEIASFAAFDPNADITNDYPVRFIWSQKNQPESATDRKREFYPLDFKDGQYRYGEVMHHAIGNGELYSWQERLFQRWNFDSNNLINTSNGVEIILGSGAVMSKRPLELSGYGCANKWAVIKGVAAQGGDTFYWLNTDKRAFIRFGYDGTTQQSLIHGMDSWIRNNISMVIGKDTPADNEGIHGVWNHQFQECIITVRGWRSGVPQFDAVVGYDIGVPVMFGSVGYEQFPGFFTSLINNNVFPPDTFPELWQQVPLTNNTYYNVWTLVFSEIKNGFDGFLPFHPRIYSPYRNTYLSQNPISNVGEAYEHNRGTYSRYYAGMNVDGLFRGVMNLRADATKKFKAARMRTAIRPARVNFKTTSMETYMLSADPDMIFREEKYDFPIKNDSTITAIGLNGAQANPTGLNDIDTSVLFGDFCEYELIYNHGEYQSLDATIIKGEFSPRINES